MRTSPLFHDSLGWLLLLIVALPVALAGAAAARPAPVTVPRQVLAFYYGWWGTPAGGGWRHWEGVDTRAGTIANTAHYPVDGAYDSHDSAVVERQLGQMQAAGITGLIASWWGKRGFDDDSLTLVLRLAVRHRLAVTAYYETVPEVPAGASSGARVDAAVADLEYLLDRHGADPAWLRVGRRPVIFVFRRAIRQLGTDGWWVVNQRMRRRSPAPLLVADIDLDEPTGAVAATFAGVHSYNDSDRTAGKSPAELSAWAAAVYPRWAARWRGSLRGLTVIPGFGNTKTGDAAARRVTERHGGDTYRVLAEQAIAADPDWLLLTSWNEWHEGTEIEPSVENGDAALRETRRIAGTFLTRPARRLALAGA